MQLRDYQQRTLDQLYDWWMKRPRENPIVTVPTGGGKSVIIAELCRVLFDTWPDEHPRAVVLTPSKELCEQNYAKLANCLPSHIRLGYYSASLGRKQPDADVIVATIGSIYRSAHTLGNIRCVIIDECHLVNPAGSDVGRYRQFLTDLSRYCEFRVVGYTATPFRGNGIWLTDGDDPLFHGVAAQVTIKELLDRGFLAPLVRPVDAIQTRIDTTGVKIDNGDYDIAELAVRVDQYLEAVVQEACRLAAERRKWLAFCPTVDNAKRMATLLTAQGAVAAVVTGETPKAEREELISQFRAGQLRCLVTVLALATGFDVPDLDCIIWLRPTRSPVLYVQGAGRGLRTAPGKTDCLWLDFSDTTERLGPIDTIKGRLRPKPSNQSAKVCNTKVCNNCGERSPINATFCETCGYEFPASEPDAWQEKKLVKASNAAVLSSQIEPKIVTYDVTRVSYHLHHPRDTSKPDSMRVDYWSGLRKVCSEWICVAHGGFAGEKARRWWARHIPPHIGLWRTDVENPAQSAVALATLHAKRPRQIVVNESGKYPELIRAIYEHESPNADSNSTSVATNA